MADDKNYWSGAGKFTSTGAALGSVVPGVGTGVGAAIGAGLDIGSAVAGYFGEEKQAEEEKQRYEREQGLAEWQMAALQEKEQRERQKRIAISNALLNALGRK